MVFGLRVRCFFRLESALIGEVFCTDMSMCVLLQIIYLDCLRVFTIQEVILNMD